ncbi:acyltransferase family protein [Candidatus Parcubacteria bacterium]|nr:acyltransferase family protein [Patescibacteria group bacterium]MBU4309208.1 acyltransferase family protein [Patescibacteria group bacterium]MBU4432628.1 acyltransferase family protein [Patescibacteria group bacterium]MBU4577569.1 acyltransferase family protein [Patescibacteria group bacterium]MCG2697256.1 acyltransferase family protein [Candidatus Parcubacteria bacterium]
MTISISNAVGATHVFIGIFLVALILSLRRRSDSEVFSVSLTHELKGLAILAIIFSHIGYFLVNDHQFLFPLSIMAGVGVNLFLFLSGFGLVVSSLQKKYSIWQFYQKRLLKLLIPFWITLAVFFVANFFIFKIGYTGGYIMQSFLGYFPRADLSLDINSPLWYFTFILFYYVIFPVVFIRKHPCVSALVVYGISYYIIQLNPVFLKEVMRLYEVHILAFPIGMFIGGMFFSPNKVRNYLADKFKLLATRFRETNLAVKIRHHKENKSWQHRLLDAAKQTGEVGLIISLLALIFYTAYYSGVGELPDVEQAISLITMAAILALFLLKKVDINLFHIFGFYSYEIYLLHWPILSHYDLFLRFMPAWLAVVLYLGLFLVLGLLLKKISRVIFAFLYH